MVTTSAELRRLAAKELGLLVDVPAAEVGAVTVTTLDIAKLADVAPNVETMRDAFVLNRTLTESADAVDYARVISFGYPATNIVTLARAPVATWLTSHDYEVYWILNPEEWMDSLNESLRPLWHVERSAMVPYVANQDEYALGTDLKTQGDLLELFERDNNPAPPLEGKLPAYSILEDRHIVTVKLHLTPSGPITNRGIVVKYRKRYPTLDESTADIVAPDVLAVPAGALKGAEKIFKKRGKGMKELFGMAMVVLERELRIAKDEIMPKFVARDFVSDDEWVPAKDLDFIFSW